MRYINIAEIKLPDGWEIRAQSALSELVSAPDAEERKKIIKRRASLWSELKQALDELSQGKCWYCESEQQRSDNAVDHFRPKGKVAECDDHGGYWWLAFDWQNYRLSCTFCNSSRIDTQKGDTGGKQDHFPIIDEDCRAKLNTDDLSREVPYLLDPTNPDDPTLLWYDYSEGRAVPKYAVDDDDEKFNRADISIRLYHLNHTKIEEKRKILYNEILDLVDIGSESLRKMTEYRKKDMDGYNYAKNNMTFVLKRLRYLLSPKAELSAVTEAYLTTLAVSDLEGRYSWVKKTLLTNSN